MAFVSLKKQGTLHRQLFFARRPIVGELAKQMLSFEEHHVSIIHVIIACSFFSRHDGLLKKIRRWLVTTGVPA